MEPEDVRVIHEVKDYEEANRYLKQGWRLLSTRAENTPNHTAGQWTVYCLGWAGFGEPVHPDKPQPPFTVFTQR